MPKQLILDSSILIALTKRNELQACLERLTNEGYEISIPQAIVDEVINEPVVLALEVRKRSPALADKIEGSAMQINAAIRQGLIKVRTVDYKKHSKVMDNVRRHLSKLEAKPEHAVKKGDPELVTLAFQLYIEAREEVSIGTLDKGLLRTLEPFRREIKYRVLSIL